MKRILLRMRIVVPVILILILTAGTADAQRLSGDETALRCGQQPGI
jgi:hypothetical protein